MTSALIPAWVVENQTRWGLDVVVSINQNARDRAALESVCYPADIAYLLDGPTFPVADGGSAVKAAVLRGLVEARMQVVAVVCDWGVDHYQEYLNLGLQIILVPPCEYYSEALFGSVLRSIAPRYVIADSIETLGRAIQNVEASRIVALLLDDFAATAQMRREPKERVEAAHRVLRLLCDGGSTLLVRNSSARLGLESACRGTVLPLDGIDICSSRASSCSPKGDCVVLANCMYPPNQSAIWELANSSRRSKGLSVVGPIDRGFSEDLTAIGITVYGYVDDPHEILSLCSVGIDPAMVGSGTSTKILTYCSLGIPTVATSFAVRGLSSELRKNVLTGPEPDSLWHVVDKLLLDYETARSRASSARSVIESSYDIAREVVGLVDALR